VLNTEEPCFVTPDMSASNIAAQNRSLYDVFALPCSPRSYIPNVRLRTLLQNFMTLSDDLDDVRSFEYSLRTNMKCLHTWKYSSGGSETKINDPNLSKYLSMINDRVSKIVNDTGVLKDALPFRLVLAKSSSKPEHRIQWNDHVVIASEAKGVEHSHYEALVQGLELGGDSSVNMWRCGLSEELAVTPVILSYGDCFQIYAVYLIPNCFPVIVQLSPPLTYLTFEGRCCIARWGIVLKDFAVGTVESLNQLTRSDGRRRNMKLGLYIAPHLFFKPLQEFHKMGTDSGDCIVDMGSTLRANLESMMLAYHLIHNIENANQMFLFPLGVVSYPSFQSLSRDCELCSVMHVCISANFCGHVDLVKHGCPVIVYEELATANGWSNTKPSPDLVQSYVDCVTKAVGVLNAANVAHMDLRPANILWRVLGEDKTKVEIRVIDLEDSVPFGYYIRSVHILRRDPRYPVLLQDAREMIPAASYHNEWFCEAVASWAGQTDVDSFSEYMGVNSESFSYKL
jgi:hypothetical protein